MDEALTARQHYIHRVIGRHMVWLNDQLQAYNHRVAKIIIPNITALTDTPGYEIKVKRIEGAEYNKDSFNQVRERVEAFVARVDRDLMQ